jgi:hypothetical protein
MHYAAVLGSLDQVHAGDADVPDTTLRVPSSRTRYLSGCRCVECKRVQSAYLKAYRARRKQAGGKPKQLTPVSMLSPKRTAPDPVGPVEAGALAELEVLTTAAKRPGLAAGALAMARLMDSPTNTAQWPAAQARLQAALSELRKGADSRTSWLTSVRAMTPRDVAGNPPA